MFAVDYAQIMFQCLPRRRHNLHILSHQVQNCIREVNRKGAVNYIRTGRDRRTVYTKERERQTSRKIKKDVYTKLNRLHKIKSFTQNE